MGRRVSSWLQRFAQSAVPLPLTAEPLFFDTQMYRIGLSAEMDAVISDLEHRYDETV
jgi:hypothetical protein